MFFYANGVSMGSVIDGTSNTLCVGETVEDGRFGLPSRASHWAFANIFDDCLRSTIRPLNSPRLLLGFGSAFASDHPGGANFVFCDGHTSFMSDSVDQDLYEALSTRAGGEVIDLTAF